MNSNTKKMLVSLIAGALTFIFSFLGFFNTIDYVVTDVLYQRPEVVDSRIKIIAIDEKSLYVLGKYEKWDRAYYAQLLDTLYADSEYAPELVAFDILFQGEGDPLSDAALVEAAKKANGVVLATNVSFKTQIETDENGNKYANTMNIDLIEGPYAALAQNASLGYGDSIQDGRDGRIREFYPTLANGNDTISSFSMAIANILSERGVININIPATNPGEKLILKYTGKPSNYEVLSFVDVMNGEIPKEALKDSILLVGAYAPGMMDSFNTPIDHGNQMYGVEIHANIVDAIANGRYMTKCNMLLLSLIFAIVVFIFMMIAQSSRVWIASVTGIGIIVIEFIAGVICSKLHIFVPMITLVIMLFASWLTYFGIEFVKVRRARRKVIKAFKQYVAPQIVEEIAKKGDYELKLGGQKRDVAVLFVDIRGFTPLSESLSPEQVVEVLNEYLALTTKSIFDNMGTLDKFVGDATMAVFNSPFDLDDYVYKAVATARDIVAGSEEIRKKAFEMTGKEVGFGVGVNCGEAVVGNIGCDFRMDYTAIGDTVNTAARLEANAKAGQVLLSQMVVDRLGDRVEVKPVGEIPLKGKSIPLMVYELVELK